VELLQSVRLRSEHATDVAARPVPAVSAGLWPENWSFLDVVLPKMSGFEFGSAGMASNLAPLSSGFCID